MFTGLLPELRTWNTLLYDSKSRLDMPPERGGANGRGQNSYQLTFNSNEVTFHKGLSELKEKWLSSVWVYTIYGNESGSTCTRQFNVIENR